MNGNFSDDPKLENKDTTEERITGDQEGRRPGKGVFSTIKGYLIITLLAALVFIGANSYARSGGGAGGCGGCVINSGSALYSEEDLRRLGLEYYAANYDDSDVEAVVRDFGCHQEIHIYKSGQLVKRIAYLDGQLYELPEA